MQRYIQFLSVQTSYGALKCNSKDICCFVGDNSLKVNPWVDKGKSKSYELYKRLLNEQLNYSYSSKITYIRPVFYFDDVCSN